MTTWKQAQGDVLARLAEARERIQAHDESGTLAIINQQDEFCDVAKERQAEDRGHQRERQCNWCEGFRQSGGCMERLSAIDHAVLHAEWDQALQLIDEYTAWVKGLAVPA